jgi:hypothetical protein
MRKILTATVFVGVLAIASLAFHLVGQSEAAGPPNKNDVVAPVKEIATATEEAKIRELMGRMAEAKKKAAQKVAQHLQDISVTIVAKNRLGSGEGSGVIKTRKTEDGDTINFVWTAAHVVEHLRKTRTIIDSKSGTPKVIVEFDDALVVKANVEDGRQVGKIEFDAEVVRYNAEEDLALLRIRKKNLIKCSAQIYKEKSIPPISTGLLHVGSLLGQLGSNSMTNGIMSQHGRLVDRKVFDQTTVTAFPGSCLPADMLVSMANGTVKKIVDVRPGDTVLSFGTISGEFTSDKQKWGLRPIRAGKVTALLEAGEKPIFEVKTRNRKLRASGNHPVVKVHRIADFAGRIHNIPAWTRVDELQKGDVIAVMNEHVEYNKSAEFNFSKEIGQHTDRKKFMRFLGFYVGDGYKRVRPKKGGEVSLCTFDKELTEQYANIVKEVFGSNVSLHKDGNIVYTSNVKLARDLDRWGFSGYATTKNIPNWVFRIPRELQREFLIGYIEADGWYIECGWALEAANELLVKQIRALAMHMGMDVSNIRNRQRIACLDGREIASETWSCEIYPDSKKFGADLTGDLSLLPKGLKYEIISSIKQGLSEPTYDITVDKMHNFFADGVLVHNSGGGVYLTDGRLIGLVLRGAGETFNLIVPSRRMNDWAKKAQVEWAYDDKVPLPSEDELQKLPIEDNGVHFSYSVRADNKDRKTMTLEPYKVMIMRRGEKYQLGSFENEIKFPTYLYYIPNKDADVRNGFIDIP